MYVHIVQSFYGFGLMSMSLDRMMFIFSNADVFHRRIYLNSKLDLSDVGLLS